MGNCNCNHDFTSKAKRVSNECQNTIRVLTDCGDIAELKSPKLVRDVLSDYKGYGIFRQGHASKPLADHESLVCGQFYYLLPLEKMSCEKAQGMEDLDLVSKFEPPKMSSAEYVEGLANGGALEVLQPSQKKGVWRVKLVISSKELEQILSEQVNTEALIEKMRMAALSSSGSVTPRQSKRAWVLGWKPALYNLFKVSIDQNH